MTVELSEHQAEDYHQRYLTAQDGLKLAYREYGDTLAPGVPLLCLSGLTRQAGDFHNLACRLAHHGAQHGGTFGHRVLALDYRGRGRSAYDENWRNYRPEVYLGDILDLAAAANLPRLVIVGTSLGGLLAMALALQRPTLLAGVILNDVGPEIAGGGFDRIAGYVGTPAPQDDWQAAISYLRHLFSPAYPGLGEEAWLDMARNTFRPGNDGRLHLDYDLNLAKALKASPPPPDLWPLFGALRNIPTLAIRGALSDLLSPATFDRMAAEKPDLERLTVPDRGQTPMLDEIECQEAIDAFLARL